MSTKKILSIVFSVLFMSVFAFVLTWGIINFNKVKDGISSTGVYTKEDVENSYKDGYNTALENEKEYTKLIDDYRDIISEQTNKISSLSSEIADLNTVNNDYSLQISNLEKQKSDLQLQVNNLNSIKENNDSTINDLNLQIVTLQKEVDRLTESNTDYTQLLNQKNNQINALQNSVSQLQLNNELNLQTIDSLNSQIISLNSQISDMNLQIQNNSSVVASLNNQINDLKNSIAYYEEYISNLEDENQVVATFEFDGSVYCIQVVAPGSPILVTDPESTDYVIFNYWTVSGVPVDLTKYTISSNTKFIADVTYKYDVKYIVDETVINNQIVLKDDVSSVPATPLKDGYEFLGWSINGIDVVDPTSVLITSDTTFIAKFAKLHTVKFMVNNEVYDTQVVRNGNCPIAPLIPSVPTGYSFKGWTVNGIDCIDITSNYIYSDVVFIANIELMVIQFDGSNYRDSLLFADSEIVFDYYTYENQYLVNGLNIIEGIEPTVLASNSTYTIDQYIVDSKVYVLSNCLIQLTGMNGMFSGSHSTSIVLNNFDSSKVTSMNYAFSSLQNITSLDLSILDTSNVTKMQGVFSYSRNLVSINLSSFDTSNVTDMSRMFYNCLSLVNFDLSSFDTSNVTNMSYMFADCDFSYLDLTSFNTSSVTNMSYMFESCNYLTSLDISNFNTINVTDMSSMFRGCVSLSILDISNFDTSNVTTINCMFYMMKNVSTIYVSELWTTESIIDKAENVFYNNGSLSSETSGLIYPEGSEYRDVSYANYITGFLTLKQV